MKIKDTWKITDRVSGLRIVVRIGKKINSLHIKHLGKRMADNRDFFFDKNGAFDGTGSDITRLS